MFAPLIGQYGETPWFNNLEIGGYKKVDQSIDSFVDQHSTNLIWAALNACAMTDEMPDKEVDYTGRWEDAFLYNGFENGKFRFLTAAILECVKRHGFLLKASYHNRVPIPKGTNYIITEMHWKGISCIPETDVNGNKVNKGYTEPRLYLPDIIQQIFDREFGYDKEVEKPY